MTDIFEETHSFQAAGIKITCNVIEKIFCGSFVRELFIIYKQLVIGDLERQRFILRAVVYGFEEFLNSPYNERMVILVNSCILAQAEEI